MNISFEGKRALVTGAGKGIGRDLAKALAQSGAVTFAVSRTLSDLESLKKECPSINVVHCDLTDFTNLESHVKSCLPIDLLVNNAAIAIVTPFLEIPANHFDKHMDINLKVPFLVSQIVAGDIVKRKSTGSIVNVSSQASSRAIPDHTIYGTSKAALDQLTRSMALELGPLGIRVNAVNPTVVNTAMARVGWSDPAKAEPMIAKIAMRRFAEVEDVNSVIMFLLSDKAAMVTGSCIPVDGGALCAL